MSNYRETLMSDDISELMAPDRLEMVKEYCQLAALPHLSEEDANRMSAILEKAETDGWLDFWIHQADGFLACQRTCAAMLEPDLADTCNVRFYEDRKAHLREYLEAQFEKDTSASLWEEFRARLNFFARQVQENLRYQGFDPGPVDGVMGDRTQAALRQFQQLHHLEVDGLPNSETRDALGLSTNHSTEHT